MKKMMNEATARQAVSVYTALHNLKNVHERLVWAEKQQIPVALTLDDHKKNATAMIERYESRAFLKSAVENEIAFHCTWLRAYNFMEPSGLPKVGEEPSA